MNRFYNTLTRKIEDFEPLDQSEVKLYTCGPTVYDAVHIGNLRAYVFNDLLKRSLSANGFKVRHVMNITDVDDKTIKKADGKKGSFQELTKKYEDKFWQDFTSINCLKPDQVTRATDYIAQIVEFVDTLIRKGLAYKAADGSVYFSIDKFANYGQLSLMDKADLKPGARVGQDEYTKENPADFVLWKAWDEDDGEIYWEPSELINRETPLEKGRPGWSIECSVMSTNTLGTTLDIHTGGVDLIFPHHENEIAQSEGYSGQKFVRFWLHNEHLLVNGAKMSKSLKNFYCLGDIIEKDFSPLDFRYLCLSSHYRNKLNFTWEGLKAAKNSLAGIKQIVQRKTPIVTNDIENQITEALNNDLDTPKALALLHEAKSADLWLKFDQVLGLGLSNQSAELTEEQRKLVEERNLAREKKDFTRADELRQTLEKQGILLEDTDSGTNILTK